MKRTRAAQVIIQPLCPGPGVAAILEVQGASVVPPGATLPKYASKSERRCSTVAAGGVAVVAAVGGGVAASCALAGIDMGIAIIAMAAAARARTLVRYRLVMVSGLI